MTGKPKSSGSGTSGNLPLRIRAEAAAWLAGLSDTHRSSELESSFRRWLLQSDRHRVAWERQSEAWDLAGGLTSQFESRCSVPVLRPRHSGARRMVLAAAVSFAAIVAVVLFWFISLCLATISTEVGEQRVAILPDGSRVTLNTDTRIRVLYDSRWRRVRLERGEALFDVKKGENRPFIVSAGEQEIRALGTAFEVRSDERGLLSVTLIEGRISIASPAARYGPGARAAPAIRHVTVLASPGQRVTFGPRSPPKMDRPVLQQVIAWQSGEVVFNDTPLPEAAREMNRYSDRQIRVDGTEMSSLHVGGLFRAGDPMTFARAMAETFRLEVRKEADTIVISQESQARRQDTTRNR